MLNNFVNLSTEIFDCLIKNKITTWRFENESTIMHNTQNGSGMSHLWRMCEETEEAKHILCHNPRLQNSRQEWLGMDELGDVSICGLENLVGFVMDITWI